MLNLDKIKQGASLVGKRERLREGTRLTEDYMDCEGRNGALNEDL